MVADAETPTETVVIGLGNRLRGDDAAGLEVARLVRRRAPDLRVLEHEREPSDLIGLWQGARLAIVIDALGGEAPATISRLELGEGGLAPRPSPVASTHALGLGEVVELARALDRLPRRLIVIGVKGRRFDTGTGLSPGLRPAVREAAELVLAELGRGGGA
jgi:hydrogenase maturation protease